MWCAWWPKVNNSDQMSLGRYKNMSTMMTTMCAINPSATQIRIDGIGFKNTVSNCHTNGCAILSQPHDDTLDMLCVGFGPASLAIATALHDSNKILSSKVLFLEKEPKFSWHSGMQIPGSKMQISFLKDLATLRNPRSRFTFVNYLFTKGRLNQFINLSTHLPSRIEFEDYLRWCASYFEAKGLVRYGMMVQSVCAGSKNAEGKIMNWEIRALDTNGCTAIKRARNVVIAVGGKPNIPPQLQGLKNVAHSSQFINCLKNIQDQETKSKPRFAVIGSGQSAAEIFNDLWTRFPGSEIKMIMKGDCLRPADDSPFVNEIFDPDRVDGVFAQLSQERATSLNLNRSTNYGVVYSTLLEHLYEKLYLQRITSPFPPHLKAQIISSRIIVKASEMPNSRGIILTLGDPCSRGSEETIETDYIFAATGYSCDAHNEILVDMQQFMFKDTTEKGDPWPVQRDYRILFDPEKVDSETRIWLQGCNEKTHGLSDTLLSILAVRGGELVKSIFGS